MQSYRTQNYNSALSSVSRSAPSARGLIEILECKNREEEKRQVCAGFYFKNE